MCRRSVRLFDNGVWVASFCVAGVIASCATRSNAEEIDYPDFSYTFGLEINGEAKSAVVQDESVLRIVPAKQDQAGTFFYNARVPVTAFSTQFSFRLSEAGGVSDGTEAGADGFVFALQPVSASSDGVGGGALAFCDVSPSVGVEFDTYQNFQYGDVSTNHLGVNTNGDVMSQATLDVADRFDNGKIWYAWIDYDGTTLEVRANQTGDRPDAPLLKYSIDIPKVIGSDTAYVGFTAATGSAWANHDLLSWRFEDKLPQ